MNRWDWVDAAMFASNDDDGAKLIRFAVARNRL